MTGLTDAHGRIPTGAEAGPAGGALSGRKYWRTASVYSRGTALMSGPAPTGELLAGPAATTGAGGGATRGVSGRGGRHVDGPSPSWAWTLTGTDCASSRVAGPDEVLPTPRPAPEPWPGPVPSPSRPPERNCCSRLPRLPSFTDPSRPWAPWPSCPFWPGRPDASRGCSPDAEPFSPPTGDPELSLRSGNDV